MNKRKIYITYLSVNSRMWTGDRGKDSWEVFHSLDILKEDLKKEDVVLVNVLNNLALVNFLKKNEIDVEYKEEVDFIHANPGDIIYEFFGNLPLRDFKTEDSIPESSSLVIRRHEYLVD